MRESIEPALVPLTTFVVWVVCAGVGVGGLLLRYPRAGPASEPSEPPPVQTLNVSVTDRTDLSPPLDIVPRDAQAAEAPPEAPSLPPLTPQSVAAPAAPPVLPVAVPSPAIPFALPVEQARAAADAKPATIPPRSLAPPVASVAPSMPQRLVLGQGEGRQPAPEYPREAAIAREEGTVVVRFSVEADGTVRNVRATQPCASAILNQAAMRAVRETWRFRTGPVREYEVAIQFQLRQR